MKECPPMPPPKRLQIGDCSVPPPKPEGRPVGWRKNKIPTVQELIDKYLLSTLDHPMNDLVIAVNEVDKSQNTLQRTTWALIRLLLLQSLGRVGFKASKKEQTVLFPLNQEELNTFIKLANAMNETRKTSLAVRKFKDDKFKDKEKDILPEFEVSDENIDKLIEHVKKENNI